MENQNIANSYSWSIILPAVIAALLLFYTIPEGKPYDFYTLLRVIITGVGIYLASTAHRLNNNLWMYSFIGITILFNPLLPVHLDKGTWSIIDFIVASMFLFGAFSLNNKRKINQ